MKIKVTQNCIDKGKRLSARYCPVAIALFLATGEKWLVSNLKVRRVGDGKLLNTPMEVAKFVDNFDFNYCTEPFEFELDVN